jgi:gluconokinase
VAKSLSLPFIDGDDLHPQSNVDKMSAGHPLNDEDRAPWLARIRAVAEEHAISHQQDDSHIARPGLVVACSALKQSYRAVLRGERHARRPVEDHEQGAPPPAALPTYFVFIKPDRDVILKRMQAREGHFMKPAMLDSQLATLESPEFEGGVVTVPLDADTETQVKIAREGVSRFAGELGEYHS